MPCIAWTLTYLICRFLPLTLDLADTGMSLACIYRRLLQLVSRTGWCCTHSEPCRAHPHLEGNYLQTNTTGIQINICWCVLVFITSRGGRMSRASASCCGRSENPKITGSSLEPTDTKPGQVKPKTLKLILVTS